jgi:pilus assembly protein CpaC
MLELKMKTFALGKSWVTVFLLGMAVLLPSGSAVAQSEGQALHVFVGKSVVINVQAPVTRILSSNPAVIDTLATSPTQIVVEGKAAGSSSLIFWDATGHSQMLDVTVDVNIAHLRSAIEQTYPGETINIQSDGAHLILTGNVSEAKISEDIAKMAAAYSSGVVNSLSVAPVHEQQVLLEVKFAEVDRTKIQQFGINIFGPSVGNTVASVTTGQFSPPLLTTTGGSGSTVTGTINVTDPLNIFAFRPDINLGASIRDLENKSVLQILAEPNVLALNGQKASFLVGGEFPVPIVQGGQSIGVVTIQFRPFGVKLDFTAFIGKDKVIRLHVSPEVSTLDFSNAAVISGFTIPALSTRRAETEIELRDGQPFAIAGLLDNRAQVQMSKIPGIGDIPILGNLFKTHNTTRSNTDLLVFVTPHVIDPIKGGAPVPLPPPNPIKFLDNPDFDKNLPHKAQPGTSNIPSNEPAPSAK